MAMRASNCWVDAPDFEPVEAAGAVRSVVLPPRSRSPAERELAELADWTCEASKNLNGKEERIC